MRVAGTLRFELQGHFVREPSSQRTLQQIRWRVTCFALRQRIALTRNSKRSALETRTSRSVYLALSTVAGFNLLALDAGYQVANKLNVIAVPDTSNTSGHDTSEGRKSIK